MVLLLTAAGKPRYETVRYCLAGGTETVATAFAAEATVALVGDVDEVALLVTPELKESSVGVADALRSRRVRVSIIEIPSGATSEDVWRIFERALAAIPVGARLRLDLTNGLRSLPFVLFATAVYARSLHGAQIAGIHYGAHEAQDAGVVPIFDLSALAEAVEWAFTLETLKSTGNLSPLTRRLGSECKRAAIVDHRSVRLLSGLRARLTDLSRTLPTGLPLDAGLDAARALVSLAHLEDSDNVPTALAPALPVLRSTLAPFALPLAPLVETGSTRAPASSVAPSKGSVELTIDELRRQLALVDAYQRWGLTDRALLVLREWIVSRCLLAAGCTAGWLDYGRARHPMERELALLAERRRFETTATLLDPQQADLVALWQAVAEARNRIAHAGITPEPVTANPDLVGNFISLCRNRDADDAFWATRAFDGPWKNTSGRVLLSPLGLSPGVLFTALSRLDDVVVALVVATREAAARIPEVVERVGRACDVQVFEIESAHELVVATTRALGEWCRDRVATAASLVVNLTGGTTAMQYYVERAASEAQRLGVPIERVFLVDSRGTAEQQADPWVLGQLIPVVEVVTTPR